MLSRTGHIDLSAGSLDEGIKKSKIEDLNWHSIHQVNPDCLHCAYMPYCGIDVIDDISRYGRMDVPKQETWFCNKQITLFDIIFEKVALKNKKWLDVFLKWIYRTNSPVASYELFND